MEYINKKTQAVIETACVISGANWIEVDEKPATQTKRKAAAEKKGGEDKK